MNTTKILLLAILASSMTPSYALYIKPDHAAYQGYLNKINSNTMPNIQSTNLYELRVNEKLENWLSAAERLIESRLDSGFKSRLVLSISSEGYIEHIDILDIKETDIESFQRLCSKLMDIKLPKLQEIDPVVFKQNQMLKIVLDTDLNYIERASMNYLNDDDNFILSTRDLINTDLLKIFQDRSSLDAKLISPQNITYGHLGEIVELATINTKQEITLKGVIIDNTTKHLAINVFEIQHEGKILPSNLTYQINNNKKKNFTVELLNSGLNTALQGGILNGISSYGIVPASLAIIGVSGKALQLKDTSVPMNLSAGDTITIERTKP